MQKLTQMSAIDYFGIEDKHKDDLDVAGNRTRLRHNVRRLEKLVFKLKQDRLKEKVSDLPHWGNYFQYKHHVHPKKMKSMARQVFEDYADADGYGEYRKKYDRKAALAEVRKKNYEYQPKIELDEELDEQFKLWGAQSLNSIES